ncbi:hypothetical protein B0H16DRAFT_1449153 [Mycena metata]|uniref:Peptidase S53 domain-containing protein n=1 Tax=Mycena metata TaxID=1033252 RepID=A0AAD7K2N0_9AGAR|nr:hypothetical protein B0H16DRAFT_1449153 [Mycena metata]
MAWKLTHTLSVSLPSELIGHVDVVHPTIEFTDPSPRLVSAMSFSLDRRAPSASCNTSNPSGAIAPTCLQLYGIPSKPAAHPSNKLGATFLEEFRPDISPNTTFSLLTLDNGTNPQESGWRLTSTKSEFGSSLAMFEIVRILSIHLIHLIHSKICHGNMALGSRGISVIFSSGDGGTRGNHDSLDVCANNTFSPVFPVDCPSGRGYPNIALQGWNFDIVVEGFTETVAGTSCSAPVLRQSAIKRAGRPTLGFLNPFIYSTGRKAFTGITIGHDSGWVCPASTVAFDAMPGWYALSTCVSPDALCTTYIHLR